ncbi:MAG: hypothetical protein ACRC5S_03325 [Cetobacterium sp.]
MKKIIIGMFIIAGIVQAFPGNKKTENTVLNREEVIFVPPTTTDLVFTKEGDLFTGILCTSAKSNFSGKTLEYLEITEVKSGYRSGLQIVVEKDTYKVIGATSFIGNLENGLMKDGNQYMMFSNGAAKNKMKIDEKDKEELNKKIEKLINDYKKKQR